MVTTLVLLLAAGVLAYVALGVLQTHRRNSIGLNGSTVLAADDSRIGSPTLRAERLRLVGRPDQLVSIGRQVIPVEQKPRARRVQDSHVLQVAAGCLLVSEVYGVRPAFGVLVLANGRQHRVAFTPDLEQRLLQTLARMHALLDSNQQPRPRWLGARCQACGLFSRCWE
jgi:CRISPR/Cas system-associated exonuclease Cas4 (RecB family)